MKSIKEIKECLKWNWTNKKCNELFEQNEELVNLLKSGHTIKDLKHIILCDLEIKQYRCPICNEPIHVLRSSKGFQKTCGKDACRFANIKNYYQNNYGINSPLSLKSVKEKIRRTNIERYGTDNPAKCEKVKEKIKNTCLKKYGVEHTLQDKNIRKRIEETNLKKYGFTCSFKNDDVKRKFRENYLEKHGVDHPWKDENVKNTIAETNIKKYGNKCTLHGHGIKEKAINTLINKYGVDSPLKSKEIKARQEETNLKRYGSKEALSSESIIGQNNIKNTLDKSYNSLFNMKTIVPLFDRSDWHGFGRGPDKIYKIKCKECGTIFHSYIIGTNKEPRCLHCNPYNISTGHKSIVKFIKEIYCGEIQINNRKELGNRLELDIYMPDIKLAIEYNGVYFHSVNLDPNNKFAHINKTELSESKGIHLIHIFEDEWWTKNIAVKNHITNMINLKLNDIKIDFKLKKIENDDYYEFVNSNSLIDYKKCEIAYGIYKNDNLTTVISFDNICDNEWLLCNICSTNLKLNHIEEILKQFEIDYAPKTIMFIANRCLETCNNNIFEKYLGFKLIEKTNIEPFYTNGNVRTSNMHESSQFELYDCGKAIFEKKL